jgi:hypothetical protein
LLTQTERPVGSIAQPHPQNLLGVGYVLPIKIKTMLLEEQLAPSWWGCLCAVCFERELFAPAGIHLVIILLNQRSRARGNEGKVKDSNQRGWEDNNNGVGIAAGTCVTDLDQEQMMRY